MQLPESRLDAQESEDLPELLTPQLAAGNRCAGWSTDRLLAKDLPGLGLCPLTTRTDLKNKIGGGFSSFSALGGGFAWF